MPSGVSFREINLSIFRGEPVPHVLFQPRLEPWYDWQTRFGTLPQHYRDSGLLGFFDEFRLSMRYVHYYTNQPDPIERRFDEQVKVHEKALAPDERLLVYETPYGEMTERHRFTVDETWREVDFPVKGPDDLVKLRWLLEHMTYTFSPERFRQGSEYVGRRGVPQFWLPKSPYQALAQQWMKLKDLVYALADCPQEVEATMQAIDESHEDLYRQVTASGVVQIVNFGENIHDHLFSPRYFERYMIPWFEKRCGQLRQVGIYSHVHIDGYFRTLLRYLKDLPFDGLEALTPQPQGDVTLEEIKEHIGDKILLDGIPAVYFLPDFSPDTLMRCVERVAELFHPRLVLGVSDEVPEGAEPVGAIEKIRMVSDWCLGH